MTKRKFSCEYCHSVIGYVDLEKLAEPMRPVMFSSINPKRGIPDPFHPSLLWLDFKCPYCRLRPFLEEGWITLVNDKGRHERLRIDRIDIDRKARLENQAKIEQAWGEESATPPHEAPEGLAANTKSKFKCPKCGKGYAHQSSLARHKKVCNG